MTKLRNLLVLTTGLLWGLTSHAVNRVAVHYNERPPYMSTADSGIAIGLTATPASRAFQSAGIPHYWTLTPSIRQLEIIRQNTGRDCAIGWFKNPEREAYAKYSKVIYQDKPTIGLALASNTKIASGDSIENVLKNKNIRVLVKSGYSYGAYIDGLIQKLEPTIYDVTVENINMLQMLNVDRADFFFIAEEEAEGLIEISGFPAMNYQYINFIDAPFGNKRYIICSMQVEDSVIDGLNQWLP